MCWFYDFLVFKFVCWEMYLMGWEEEMFFLVDLFWGDYFFFFRVRIGVGMGKFCIFV